MDIGPAELLPWGRIPRYRPLVTSVTDHQNACDLVKRFWILNAEIHADCSCDLLLRSVTFVSLNVASRSRIILAASERLHAGSRAAGREGDALVCDGPGAGSAPVAGDWLSGRAPRSHRGGHWFDPSIAHQVIVYVDLRRDHAGSHSGSRTSAAL